MRGVGKVFLAGFFLALSAAWGTPIYNNTTTDTGDTLSYAANGFVQIGDQLQLAGTDRLATLARVQFFNDGQAGSFDATLRLFSVGAIPLQAASLVQTIWCPVSWRRWAISSMSVSHCLRFWFRTL